MKVMKRIFYMSLAALTLGISSCTNEELSDSSKVIGNDRIVVDLPGATTRTHMDETDRNKVLWTTGDEISIFSVSSNQYTNNKYTLSSGGNTQSGEFTGSVSEGSTKKAAFYPYVAGTTFDGSKISFNMSNNLTLDADKPTENNKAPMACIISPDAQDKISFKNAGALLDITVRNIPTEYKKIVLTSKGENAPSISGAMEIEFSDGDPTLKVAGTATTAASEDKTVAISFTLSVLKDLQFFFPIPAGTYPELSLTLYKDNESTGTELRSFKGDSDSGLTVAKGERLYATVIFDKVTGDIAASVNSTSDVKEALKESDAVSVIGEITGVSNTVTVPTATSGSTGETTKSLSLEKVASGASLQVSDENSSGSTNNSVDNFILSIPNNETTDFQPLNVTVTMPNTTVTLTGNAGAAIYGTVTSETADNTLVIGNGVEVKKVVVKKGNIRVNKGAKLVAIEKSSDNQATTVTVYQEDGAEIPSSLDKSFVVVDAAVVDMKKVLADGGTYTLSNDMEGDFVVSATTSVTINLNGHKITNKVGDTFTVNSGSSLTIEGEGIVDNVTHARACIYNNGKVLLDGGTYTRSLENGQSDTNAGGNSYYNILNHGEMTINQSVSVSQSGKFSSMIASGYYDYSNTNPRNGHVEGTNDAAPKLTINGGTFSGGLNTIKNDDGATLEIKGGTFNNMSQATVQNHHVTTISGGTFNCSGAKYAVDNEGHNDAEQDMGDMTISGGTFSGLMLNVGNGADMTITGGTFSDLSALSYLQDNANVNVVLNKDYNTPTGAGITLDKETTVTVDLNGYNITNNREFDDGGASTYGFNISKGMLTIKNSNAEKVGKISCVTDESCTDDGFRFVIYAHGTSTVNIEGGSFYNKQTKNTQIDLVSVYDNAKVYISGGTFESGCYGTPDNDQSGRYWVLNKKNDQKATCVISVSGGTFINFNPGNPNMDDDTSYLAAGYSAYLNDAVATEAYGAPATEGRKTYVVKPTPN